MFELGQGIGKHGQGILNPIKAELRPAQGGIGFVQKVATSSKRKGRQHADDHDDAFGVNESAVDQIDMDIHDRAGEKKREEEAQEKKQRLDAEDKAFLELF